MYAGAFLPGLLLTGLYVLFAVGVTYSNRLGAGLPAEARTFREPNGGSGTSSLVVLVIIAVAASVAFSKYHYPPMRPWTNCWWCRPRSGSASPFSPPCSTMC